MTFMKELIIIGWITWSIFASNSEVLGREVDAIKDYTKAIDIHS